jgi:ABC-type Mn2+/Zn2+ transport system permease subunit
MAKKFLYFIILWIILFPFFGYGYILIHFENGIYTIEKLKGDVVMSLIMSFVISLGLVVTLAISQKQKNKENKEQ